MPAFGGEVQRARMIPHGPLDTVAALFHVLGMAFGLADAVSSAPTGASLTSTDVAKSHFRFASQNVGFSAWFRRTRTNLLSPVQLDGLVTHF